VLLVRCALEGCTREGSNGMAMTLKPAARASANSKQPSSGSPMRAQRSEAE